MDVRFLSSIVEVVEVGSIAEAARNQNLTSAAISQRIKSLETTLGCQLLNRTGHSAKPTAKCLKLLPRFKRIISEVEAIPGDIDEVGLSGELRVGAISTVLLGVLPKVLQELSYTAPDLKIKITPGTSTDLYRKLTDKKIDVSLTVNPPFVTPKNIKKEVIYFEELGLIHTHKNAPNLKELIASQPYIQYDKLSWGGRLVERYLYDNQLTVTPVCEIDSLESISIMVQQGMGVSLIPMWKGMKNLFNNLEVIPVKDKRYQRHITLLSHLQIGKEPLIKVFNKAVLTQVGDSRKPDSAK
ncbi:LysR family transcriptional regulator [Photobacterium sp. ZSDE20]|uniref:LysR family transcriptional regulator n=1 Tax=Photobacterium pectinilyticum TaxID=2906793 RepID=A0ABT1N8Y4_9GAMM|nr:LysR family transcriptional regulator [Photobacterium sp. ZSDE20]MCQ1061198.1 LysR family transcriptional regulator [Photobacterium sp. ZSDE20]MDD1829565.1 LysR family transcriptional regulator [Photobacterium sp. ZSDE20]